MVKEMAQKRFQAKVSFLEKALASTNVEETRTALGQALAKAETDKVYSESTLPFAAEFLAPPASPLQPQFPKFFITMIIFVALGIVVYLLDVYFVVRTSKSVWETIFANLRRSSDDGVRARSDSSRRTVL
jgi:lipopolysaccharide export LptBFGC system permease protein LptF